MVYVTADLPERSYSNLAKGLHTTLHLTERPIEGLMTSGVPCYTKPYSIRQRMWGCDLQYDLCFPRLLLDGSVKMIRPRVGAKLFARLLDRFEFFLLPSGKSENKIEKCIVMPP